MLPKYRICHADYPHLTWPGNMIGLLDPLPGRCTSWGAWALQQVGNRKATECNVLREMNDCSLLAAWPFLFQLVWETPEDLRSEKVAELFLSVRIKDGLFAFIMLPVPLARAWPYWKIWSSSG